MTRVSYTAGSGRHTIIAKGHAEGSEQVCAAVSGILGALGGYLLNDETAQIHGFALESGDVLLDASGGEGLEGAYYTALIGLLQLQEEYGEYICVSV